VTLHEETGSSRCNNESVRLYPSHILKSVVSIQNPSVPDAGAIVHVRQRLYLVEQVIAPPTAGEATLVRLSCVDDDAQGQPLDVLWEQELDAEIRNGENWQQMAERGFDPAQRFAAYLNTLRWNCVTSTDPKLLQSPFRAGNMTSLTYPDGRVVNQAWNSAGQLSQVADNNGYQYMTSQSTYWPNGAPQAIWYGNGVANGYHMNNRLQVDEIGNIRVGTSAPGGYSEGTSLTRKHYCFGPATPPLSSTIAACPTLASANNGNIWQAQDSLNSVRTQNFTYDTLNRIKAFATANNSASQTYAIDAWGNLSQSGTLSSTLTFDGNNKITSGGVAYDAAGDEVAVNNGVSTVNYTYDADRHILTAANGTAKYFYSSEGNRVRKDMGSTNWTEYVYLGGQALSELSSDGTWSDYVYGNGQRMARADKYDIRLHLSGTNCSNCGTNPNMFTGTTSLTAANGYTIRNGDVLSWRQYQSGSTTGGLYLFFTDGTDGLAARDADGQLIDQDQTMNTWHMRTVDLSAYAGKTIQLVDPFQWTSAPAGSWSIFYGDITLTSTDGSAIPIYSRTMMTLSLNTNSSVSNAQAITEKVADTNPITTTTFYHGDQIGSARLMTASGGWPVWSDTFYPFGQEATATSAINHYKFTGKERDSESGNDYFGARYYASTMGRFMSPDPSGLLTQHPEDPQSWNLYAYARNNPVIYLDPNGLDCVYANDAGNGVESIDHHSNSGECGQNGGSWVPGYAAENWAKFNVRTQMFQVGSYTSGDSVDYTTFEAGAKTQWNGDESSCTSGCTGFASANADWLVGQLVGNNQTRGIDGYIQFLTGRTQPLSGGTFSQIAFGPLDYSSDHWAGPGGFGPPGGAGDWRASVHDYNFSTNGPTPDQGITISMYFNPRLSPAVSKALIESNNYLMQTGGYQGAKEKIFFGIVNAFQWVSHVF